jgi:methylthioribulose-1-phosphate dehydratase
MFDSFGFESELFKNMIGTQYIRKTAINTEHPPITIGFNCNISVIIISEIDFIPIDENGYFTGNNLTFKPSAETAIHLFIYKLFPENKIILHSHGLYPVLLSSVKKNYFEFQGNEIQKGFDVEVSHLSKLRIPLLENSQDMSFFEKELWFRKSEILHSCFAISKHGTYAWGKNLFEAKKHLETLDYLCQLEWNLTQK